MRTRRDAAICPAESARVPLRLEGTPVAMMEIWRLLLCFVLCFLVLRRIRRNRIKRKRAVSVISVVLILCLVSLTAVFPVENLFVHFETPESAFRYASSGTVVNTIPGSDSCLVVYSTDSSTYRETIFPMTEQGYQCRISMVSRLSSPVKRRVAAMLCCSIPDRTTAMRVGSSIHPAFRLKPLDTVTQPLRFRRATEKRRCTIHCCPHENTPYPCPDTGYVFFCLTRFRSCPRAP